MQKIVLTAATFLFASGMAFAGSDHYGSDFNHGSGYDYSNPGHYSMVKLSATSDDSYWVDLSGTASISTADSAPTYYGQGIWGR
jgi:hypothetical protein